MVHLIHTTLQANSDLTLFVKKLFMSEVKGSMMPVNLNLS